MRTLVGPDPTRADVGADPTDGAVRPDGHHRLDLGQGGQENLVRLADQRAHPLGCPMDQIGAEEGKVQLQLGLRWGYSTRMTSGTAIAVKAKMTITAPNSKYRVP
jgi:hypothetical protein